jgi:predicted exporter
MLMGAGGAGSEVEFLDLKAQSDLLLHRYRREALLLAAFGAAAISVLLLASLRSVRESLIVLAPLGCAVVGTVALLTLRHGQLSIFNIFGLLLVVAVGSNYCLFFQRGGMHGATGARTATSLLLANLCTVIGFGTLSISHIPVLSGIGGTVALGTALSLAAGAILAPERAGGVR